MKLLVVADLHYSLKQFDWIVAQSEFYDAVVLAGDLLDISSHLDLEVQILVVRKYLRRIAGKTPVFVCSGNHDLDARNQHYEAHAEWLNYLDGRNLYVDGRSLVVDRINFTVFPWWDGPKTREELVELFEQGDEARKREKVPWVWIYHSPPFGTKTSWTGRKDFGDRYLSEWIKTYQPDLVLSGHIHNAPFHNGGAWVDRIENTWVFNPGKQIGDYPTHIRLDMKKKNAEWISYYDSEKIDL